ncbi:MAG: nicotinate (nicotinamide) nucleotide adenylyltransferase [Bacilli bacterium]|nr:nicotinate (nicotinamide) nucleotide adenylyltransferase [Bacilli bacterium]
MMILYGGAFNPPTIAHQKIIEYLIHRFPIDDIVILPANASYRHEIVEYDHRQKMLELLISAFDASITISDYEARQTSFTGTIETLRHFNNPLFVIGCDQLLGLEEWIAFPHIVEENHFLVFPRHGIDAQLYIDHHPILHEYHTHFEVVTDFEAINVSSSEYRASHDTSQLTPEIMNYITEHHLYEVK